MRNRIRTHFETHKQLYAGLGMGLGLAGITLLIMKERHAVLRCGADELSTAENSVAMRSFSFFANRSGNIVNVIHTGAVGHPGFAIRNLETGFEFSSQADAARYFKISPSALSSHLNKGIDLTQNLNFERIAPRS